MGSGASVVALVCLLVAGCGQRYDLGPASFSIAPNGDLRVVVCEEFQLTTAIAYVNLGRESETLMEFESDTPVTVRAGEDVLLAVQTQSPQNVERNISELLQKADGVSLYVEGTANGVERSWTAGVRAPLTLSEDKWMMPNGAVEDEPC